MVVRPEAKILIFDPERVTVRNAITEDLLAGKLSYKNVTGIAGECVQEVVDKLPAYEIVEPGLAFVEGKIYQAAYKVTPDAKLERDPDRAVPYESDVMVRWGMGIDDSLPESSRRAEALIPTSTIIERAQLLMHASDALKNDTPLAYRLATRWAFYSAVAELTCASVDLFREEASAYDYAVGFNEYLTHLRALTGETPLSSTEMEQAKEAKAFYKKHIMIDCMAAGLEYELLKDAIFEHLERDSANVEAILNFVKGAHHARLIEKVFHSADPHPEEWESVITLFAKAFPADPLILRDFLNIGTNPAD